MELQSYKRTKTTEFYEKLNVVIYLSGFPTFWIEELNLPKPFIKFYDILNHLMRLVIYIVIVSEWAAIFTQDNLSETQYNNLIMFSLAHPILILFRDILSHNIQEVRDLYYKLGVVQKRVYNDLEVEAQMIKTTIMYVSATVVSCSITVIMMSFEGIWAVAFENGTFSTVITVYPDVDEKSYLADIARGICNVTWWFMCGRAMGTYILVIPITTSLSYQFKNIQSYFESLSDIFERNDLQQEEMEDLYEDKFKVGIKMHTDVLKYRNQAQRVCASTFSGEIVYNVLMLIIVMSRLATSDRTLLNLMTCGMTVTTVLVMAGFTIWNAGNITIEASELATSIFYSGWHNCVGQSNLRIRQLVVITMTNAQRPVLMKALDYMDLSYASFLKLVKTSYSVFSVLS